MLKLVDKSVLNLVGHRVLKVLNTEVTKSELYFRGNKRATVYTGRIKKRRLETCHMTFLNTDFGLSLAFSWTFKKYKVKHVLS